MLREKINELRRLLDSIVEVEEQDIDSILKVSQELDAIIVEYYRHIVDRE